MQAVPVPHRKNKPPDQHFRLGVLRANRSHISATLLWGQPLNHRKMVTLRGRKAPADS